MEHFYDYKKLDPEGSKEVILKIINETRKVGGLFVSIWHNTSLLDNKEWKGWREVFEFMLKNSETMIVYHKNNEIDREQWDNCIKNSPGSNHMHIPGTSILWHRDGKLS